MSTNETETIDSTKDTETTENTEVTTNEGDEPKEDVEALKKQIQTLEAQKDHWRKKAGDTVKPAEEATTVAKAKDLSTEDIYALMEAKVAQDDIADVREYATLKKISIADAIKAPIVRSILAEKSEQRATAAAANVGGSKRSSGRVSEEALLSDAAKGKLPESDEDLMRLVKARKGLK